jgi:aldose sugar dehydrogenase
MHCLKALSRSAALALLIACIWCASSEAAPTMTDPALDVRTVVSGLVTPTSMAFIGSNDLLVLEKNTGLVMRVTNGAIQGPVLDLSVNFASERGVLGIARHPDFPRNPGIYIFWTCRSSGPPGDEFFPDEIMCDDQNLTGADTEELLEAPLLANRVDRFEWNGTALTYDRNLIRLRAFQNDAAPVPAGQGDEEQPARGNHNGGVIAFGPDGKLYIQYGDQGRRGQLQNLPSGPTLTGLGDVVEDDQFGGPEPDDAHFSGVVIRLNDDGTTPTDNPFYAYGGTIGGQVGANIQKIYAYGFRNGFGMAFDPRTGRLWSQDNGEDAYDELNLVERGMNGGWIQFMGPHGRLADYKLIETTSLHNEDFPNLQQLRWGPERIADTQEEGRERLFMLPGARYNDPEFSWKYVVAPAAIGFASGHALGNSFFGDLFVGLSVPEPSGGPLLRFNLTENRTQLALSDPALADRVDDNADFNLLTESAAFVVGTDFGIVTDIKASEEGTLYVVSLSNGEIYEIFPSGPGQERARVATKAASGAPAFSLAAPTPVSAREGSVVQYSVPERSLIELAIFDVTGRRVATLANADHAAGTHLARWDARGRSGDDLATGVYFLRMEATGVETGARASETRRLVLIR